MAAPNQLQAPGCELVDVKLRASRRILPILDSPAELPQPGRYGRRQIRLTAPSSAAWLNDGPAAAPKVWRGVQTVRILTAPMPCRRLHGFAYSRKRSSRAPLIRRISTGPLRVLCAASSPIGAHHGLPLSAPPMTLGHVISSDLLTIPANIGRLTGGIKPACRFIPLALADGLQ